MFGTGANRDLVRTGSVFRKVWRDNTVETATVLALDDDSYGIPMYSIRSASAGTKT